MKIPFDKFALITFCSWEILKFEALDTLGSIPCILKRIIDEADMMGFCFLVWVFEIGLDGVICCLLYWFEIACLPACFLTLKNLYHLICWIQLHPDVFCCLIVHLDGSYLNGSYFDEVDQGNLRYYNGKQHFLWEAQLGHVHHIYFDGYLCKEHWVLVFHCLDTTVADLCIELLD